MTISNAARTPWFPTYSSAKQLLQLLPGVSVAEFKQMQTDIENQQGTSAQPVDWSEPDVWIEQRLKGPSQQIASKLWNESQKKCNPRHIGGQVRLAHNYGFLESSEGLYRLTRQGKAFVQQKADVLRQIDEEEGLIQLLLILSGFDSAQRKDIFPEWQAFLLEHSDSRAEATISSKLYDRLVNLLDRGLVAKEGNRYSLTAAGQTYLNSALPQETSSRRALDDAARNYKREQRKQIFELLSVMHPYRFEHLIKQLLVAMGYENVEVTKQSGDKGIDVVATARFGITTIKEVVQVKRVQSNIQRPVVDSLRGALNYASAVKGTIITLGKFSAGAKEAAEFPGIFPIGLIDGETLIDLLIEHSVGVNNRTIPVFEVIPDFFSKDAPKSDSDDIQA